MPLSRKYIYQYLCTPAFKNQGSRIYSLDLFDHEVHAMFEVVLEVTAVNQWVNTMITIYIAMVTV